MAMDDIRAQQGERLAQVRLAAGWRSARAAALENSWAESTYRAHENGTRTIGLDDAEAYARRFRARGLDVTAQYILFGPKVDRMDIPAIEPFDEFEKRTAVAAQGDAATQIKTASVPVPYIAEPNAGTVTPTIRGPDGPPLPRVQELGVGVASIDDDDSAFYLNGQTIDHVPRPPGLANRQDVFALRVANLSMWPKFRDGERVYVDTKRPAIEDFVVVELHPAIEGDPGKAYVKMLVARDGKKLTVEQFNPPGRLEFRNDEIKRVYRVIPNEELW
jgi:hypothetical protein